MFESKKNSSENKLELLEKQDLIEKINKNLEKEEVS